MKGAVLTKKREVLLLLNKAIEKLVSMSADAAKLEIYDNEVASKRLKMSINKFKHEELNDLQRAVLDLRSEWNMKKGKKKQIISPEVVKKEKIDFL